jgi:hypothetical protein
MTTPIPHDQARNLADTIHELQRTLWAFEGLSEVMDPSSQLDGQPRANVSTLISILTERFETLLGEVEQRWHSTPAATPEPEEIQL